MWKLEESIEKYDFAEFTSRCLQSMKSGDGAQMSFKVIQHKFSMLLINYQSPWSEEVKLSNKCTAFIMQINNFSIVTLLTAAVQLDMCSDRCAVQH